MLADAPTIDVREPVGEDELFLLETRLAPAPALAALAERVATVDGRRPDWDQVAAAQLGADVDMLRLGGGAGASAHQAPDPFASTKRAADRAARSACRMG